MVSDPPDTQGVPSQPIRCGEHLVRSGRAAKPIYDNCRMAPERSRPAQAFTPVQRTRAASTKRMRKPA